MAIGDQLVITDDQEIHLIRQDVRVSFVRLGEGWSGDYDPEDPDDDELYRFDISVRDGDEWLAVDDGSYCTAFPVNAEEGLAVLAVKAIMDEVFGPVSDGNRIRGAAQRLSWICPNDVKQVC